MFTLIVSQSAVAECEDLLDSDFPSEECPFNDTDFNPFLLTPKFGHVDEVGNQTGSQIPVRFGSANYIISTAAKIYVAFNDDDCLRAQDDFGFDLKDVDNFSPVREVAFIPSLTNSREIERIWVFRCSSVQFQDR